MHNDLQQRLYATQIQLNLLRDSLDEMEQPTVNEELSRLEGWLKETIRLTRHLSIDLSPPLLANEGLVQSISWLALQMKEQHALYVTIQADEEIPNLEISLRVSVYEAIRELLFNVVKHANVTRAQVTLEKGNDHLEIIVSDDGQGFDIEAVLNAENPVHIGHGLSKIRQRLALLNIGLDITSAPGKGVQVVILVPLPRPAD